MLTIPLNNGRKIVTEDSEKTLMELLVAATRKKGARLSAADVWADPELPSPNTYAIYCSSFENAAKRAADIALNEPWEPRKIRETTASPDSDAAKDDGKTRATWLSPARQEAIQQEFVKMYIRGRHRMPPEQMIRRNRSFSRAEVREAFDIGILQEKIIRELAARPQQLVKKAPKVKEVAMQIKELTNDRKATEVAEMAKVAETAEATEAAEVAKATEVKEVAEAVEATEAAKATEVISAATSRKSKSRFTREDCLEVLRQHVAYLKDGTLVIPRTKDLHEMSVNSGGPTYDTLVRHLGPRKSWPLLLGKDGEPSTEKPMNKPVGKSSRSTGKPVGKSADQNLARESAVKVKHVQVPDYQAGLIKLPRHTAFRVSIAIPGFEGPVVIDLELSQN